MQVFSLNISESGGFAYPLKAWKLLRHARITSLRLGTLTMTNDPIFQRVGSMAYHRKDKSDNLHRYWEWVRSDSTGNIEFIL